MQFTREELNTIEQKALQSMSPDMPGDLYEALKSMALAVSTVDAMLVRHMVETNAQAAPKTPPAPQVIRIEVVHTHVFKQNKNS